MVINGDSTVKRVTRDRPKFNKGMTVQQFAQEAEDKRRGAEDDKARYVLSLINDTDQLALYRLAKFGIKFGASVDVLKRFFLANVTRAKAEKRYARILEERKQLWWNRL